MVTVGLVAIKGGVGKTTNTFCLAATLTRLGKTVLCIDLDPQGDLSASLGQERDASSPGIGEILNAPKREQKHLLQQAILPIPDWTDLITCGSQLSDYEKEIEKGIAPDQRLRDAIKTIEQDYDFILIDTPKGAGRLTTNALVAADELIVPLQMEWLALNNLPVLLNQIVEVSDRLNPALVLSIVAPSQLKRTSISQQVYQSLLEWDAASALPHQAAPVWIAPPIHDLTLYTELSAMAVPIHDHPQVQRRHLEPFEAITQHLIQQSVAKEATHV